MTVLSIPLSKQEKEKLERLALRYGLSLPEFSRKILGEVTSEITEEAFDDYENPKALRTSFARAMRDYNAGRIHHRL